MAREMHEEALSEAYARRDAAGGHRYVRLLAGRGACVGSRDDKHLLGSRPPARERVANYAQPGDRGRLSATEFEPLMCGGVGCCFLGASGNGL